MKSSHFSNWEIVKLRLFKTERGHGIHMPQGRTIIIGDIHGCWKELQALLDLVTPNAYDKIFTLGNMVGCGPDSPAVVDFFRLTPNAYSLLGSQEWRHIRWQRDGIRPTHCQRHTRDQFSEKDYAQAIALFEEMPLHIELPEALLVHGFFEPGVPVEQQRLEVLLGTSAGHMYLSQQYNNTWFDLYDEGKPLVAGYLNYYRNGQPFIWKNKVFGIDTGCYRGRRLTALVLPEFRFLSVPGSKNYWREVHRKYQILNEAPHSAWPWDKIDAFLAIKPVSREEQRLHENLKHDKIQGEHAVNMICEFVKEKHSQIMLELPEDSNFNTHSASEQAATYNSKVKDSPVAPLMHQARRGGLTRKYAKRKLQSPHHALTIAKELQLDTDGAGLNVFLDDARPAPEGWVHVRWPEEAIELLQTGTVERISLGYDLGDDDHGTGYDVLLWIEEAVAERGFAPPEISIHSANISARRKMEQTAASIERFSSEGRDE